MDEIKVLNYGNYGPAELWIVGKSNDGARALDDIWCDVRVEKDPSWNTEWDCLNGDPYGSGDGWSHFIDVLMRDVLLFLCTMKMI